MKTFAASRRALLLAGFFVPGVLAISQTALAVPPPPSFSKQAPVPREEPGEASASVALNPAQKGWVARIEDTLSATQLVRARFRQVSADGQVSTGSLILARPGRMRFDYDPPSPILLVANDGKIVFQDKSIGQITTLPADHTPLGLLLQPTPRFGGDIAILGFTQAGNEIRIRVVRAQNPGEGELTLIFSAQPLALEGWDVRDPQGHVTSVRLSDVQTGAVKLPAKTFKLPKAD